MSFNFFPWNRPQEKTAGPPTFVEQFVDTLDEPRRQREVLAKALTAKEQEKALEQEVQDQVAGLSLILAEQTKRDFGHDSPTLTPEQQRQYLKAKEALTGPSKPLPISGQLHQKYIRTGESASPVSKIEMDNRSTSFAEFEQRQATDGNVNLQQLYETAYGLIGNLLFDPLVTNKAAGLRKIAGELEAREAQISKAKTKDKKPWQLLATPEGEQLWVRS